jgi:ubiquinol-cytochrome c reductase iron-sulfur subunit
MAGRVFKESPASLNLRVPPYDYVNETTLIVGVDQAPVKGAA